MPTVSQVTDFSAYVAALGSARAERIEIAPGEISLNQAPRFVLGPVPEQLGLAMLGELSIPPISCYKLHNIRVGLDGILIDGDSALSNNSFNVPDYHARALIKRLEQRVQSSVRYIPGSVVHLSGPGFHIYGHWLVDLLPRLFVLEQLGEKLEDLRFLISEPVASYVEALLCTFGISPDQLVRFDPRIEVVEVETLFIPTNLRHGMRLHPLMNEARIHLLQRAATSFPGTVEPLTGYERIFVSRQNSDQSRAAENRRRIEAIASARGFQIVRPETMSFADQIRLFRSVRQVAGEYGSGLHGVLFAPPRVVTCALRGGGIHPGFIQTSIGNVCGQATGYVLGTNSLEAVDQTFEVSELHWNVALQCMQIIADETLH